MEYGIDFMSKYTTLQINTTLDWKKMNEKQKKDTDANSPRGDGEWAQKSLFKNYFYYQKLQYHKTDNMPLYSYIEWNQDLTKCEN